MQLLEWQPKQHDLTSVMCVMQVQPSWGNVTLVIAGLTNTYSSYVTTYEEYQAQRYEGASTIFGPHTLDAYIQVGHVQFGLDQTHHSVIRKKRKDYTSWRHLNEKPSIISGCPGHPVITKTSSVFSKMGYTQY